MKTFSVLPTQIFQCVLCGLWLGVVLIIGGRFLLCSSYFPCGVTSAGETQLASLWDTLTWVVNLGEETAPFYLGLESVSLLQIAHILWSLFYRVVRWGAGLQVVSTAGNWKSPCLVYSRSRPAVITGLSCVPGVYFIRENAHHLSDFWVYLSVGYKPGKGWKVFFFNFFGHIVCGVLVPQPGIEPVSSTLEAQSANHWMAREVPGVSL